jgi:FKBP-type peptidyl-prolyl cis-trans isomerase SlpA
MKVTENSTVVVNYTGKLEDGTIFDSSLNEGREPLEVTLGQGQLIKGFEDGLVDMLVGDKKTIFIESKDAYGEYLDHLIQEVEKEKVPQDVVPGVTLHAETQMGPINFVVKEVKSDTVVLDANHPLSGKNLFFDLEVLEVK